MTYNDLTIHQKITIKGIITNKKEQYTFNERHLLDCVYAIWMLSNFKEAINLLLFKITE